jgi:hypothetical protein
MDYHGLSRIQDIATAHKLHRDNDLRRIGRPKLVRGHRVEQNRGEHQAVGELGHPGATGFQRESEGFRSRTSVCRLAYQKTAGFIYSFPCANYDSDLPPGQWAEIPVQGKAAESPD